MEPHHGPALWVQGIARSGGLTERAIGDSSFSRLSSLLVSTDENELLKPLYSTSRDANLVKIGDWDAAGNKHELALAVRAMNASGGAVDFCAPNQHSACVARSNHCTLH